MALYKDFQIEGATVTLNMDDAGVVIHTDKAVWLWNDNTASYARFFMKEGSPVTEASYVDKEGVRRSASANWVDKVTE